MAIRQDAPTNMVAISDGDNVFMFRPGFRRAEINGMAVWLNEPAEPDAKCGMRLGTNDVERFLKPIATVLRSRLDAEGIVKTEADAVDAFHKEETNSSFRVFIDPGHGGDDSGAVSADGRKEKNVVLDIALRLGSFLEEAGLEVAYSRTNDVFASLTERSVMASNFMADAFVSIHCNTTGNRDAKGVETFTLALAGSDSTSADTRISRREYPGNGFDAESSVLGWFIHSSVNTERGEADRGLRHARFQVLRQAPCAAVLVECGFLSSRAENTSLGSGRYRERFARAIGMGIIAFSQARVRETETPEAVEAAENEEAAERAGATGELEDAEPVEAEEEL